MPQPFERVYYEPKSLELELGKFLRQKYSDLPWIEIESHNDIQSLQQNPNSAFAGMKRYLIIGTRKSLGYTENRKVSDYLVPYTSSGCSAMCLYCYLVCNYNKCSYLRLFVNREQMMEKLIRTSQRSERDLVFEIGSNSDLVLENTITGNLAWSIEAFSKIEKGYLTFPTKFDMVGDLLPLGHRGRVIARMSVNPQYVIDRIEFGTSPLLSRIRALNALCDAGYRVGLLIAPVIFVSNWREHYQGLIDTLADSLTQKAKKSAAIEIIFMTYSFVHRAINKDAFPNAVELYDQELMTGRGRGRYCYRDEIKSQGEQFLRSQLSQKLPYMPIVYAV